MSWKSISDKLDQIQNSNNQKFDKILGNQTEMKINIAKNTNDLKHHIKRTDILEKRTHKMLYAVLIAIGYVAAKYGIDWIKVLFL